MGTELLICLILGAHVLADILEKFMDSSLTRSFKRRVEEEQASMLAVRFHGGPLDGYVEEASRRKPSYFVPHAPDMESEEEVKMIPMPGGMMAVEPVYAVYEAIGDEGDYFFVKDVDQEEAIKLMKGAQSDREED